jgi:acetyl esterase/lipase
MSQCRDGLLFVLMNCLILFPRGLLLAEDQGVWPRSTPVVKSLPLWPGGAPGAKGKEPADVPQVDVYLAPADRTTGAAIVVCPGGGYGFLALDHEGRQVAQWLNSLGVTAVVLHYRLAPRYHHPAPLQDAQRAMRLVRSQASAWKIDSKKVGILGFSAGGHLAATVSTHFDAGRAEAADPVERFSCRPDFAILIYPVISMQAGVTHGGSRRNLLGERADDEKLAAELSAERQVTPQTPPTFLVHTTEDKAVPPENSIFFYLALKKAGVPAELHLFERGPHGLGLGRAGQPFARWPELCAAWLREHHLLTRTGKAP